jgi:hypothetical protein
VQLIRQPAAGSVTLPSFYKLKPEGLPVNRPGSQAGIDQMNRMSAEGAVLRPMQINCKDFARLLDVGFLEDRSSSTTAF